MRPLAKFKSSDEFTTLPKKDHDTRFDAGAEVIFYNIWAHYRGLDYTFLGGGLTNLIGEWIEEERLNALNITPPSAPSSPLTGKATEIEVMPVETSDHGWK